MDQSHRNNLVNFLKTFLDEVKKHDMDVQIHLVTNLYDFVIDVKNTCYLQLASASTIDQTVMFLIGFMPVGDRVIEIVQLETQICTIISKLASFGTPSPQIIRSLTQPLSSEFYRNMVRPDLLMDTLMVLESYVKSVPKKQQVSNPNYFKFRGGPDSMIENCSTIKWPFQQGHNLMTCFYPIDECDFDLFSYNTTFSENTRSHEIGIRCHVEDCRVLYEVICRRSNEVEVVEDLGVTYELGHIKQGQWNSVGLDHEPAKTFSKPHLSYFLNEGPVKMIVAEFPRISTTFDTNIKYFNGFVGLTGSLLIFQGPIGLKLAYMQALYKDSIGLTYPRAQQQIDQLPSLFEKMLPKLYILLTPIRTYQDVVYDVISQCQFQLKSAVDQRIEVPLVRELGGMNVLLPLFYLMAFIPPTQGLMKQALATFNGWLQRSCDWVQEEMERMRYFEMLGNLIAESGQCHIDMEVMEQLVEMKSLIHRSALLDQFLLHMLWNCDIMKCLKQEMQVEKSYCMLIQSFYFINAFHFTKLKEVREIIEILIFRFDYPQGLCCKIHCFEMGVKYSDPNMRHPYQTYLIDGLLEIIGLIIESDSSNMIRQMQDLFWLAIKATPCVQIKTLRLCKKILIQKKRDNGLNIWRKLTTQLVENNILDDLLYFIQNSPCLEVKSMSIKFINLMIQEKIYIVNEFELTAFVEHKLQILSCGDPNTQPTPRRHHRSKSVSREGTRQTHRRSSFCKEVHSEVQRELAVGAMVELIFNRAMAHIDFVQASETTLSEQIHVKLSYFYDSIVEWMIGESPKELNTLTTYTETTKIVSFHSVEVLQALFSIAPLKFKCQMLANLLSLIEVNSANADILINQTDFPIWLLKMIHGQQLFKNELLHLSLELFIKLLLEAKSQTLYIRFQIVYIWARNEIRENRDQKVRWTIRYLLGEVCQRVHQDLFGLVQIVEEMIVCLDQYLKEALLTQNLDEALIPQRKQISVQMCLTFIDDPQSVPANLRNILGQQPWIDANLVQAALEQVLGHMQSLSSEEHQQDFLRQFFGATKPYMGFIRLIILFIQYQLRNPASTNATMHRWVGELSSLIIMVYCNRVAVDERDELETALIFMYSFLLKLSNELQNEELIAMIQAKATEIFAIAKPVLSKLYDAFDMKKFAASNQYKMQLLKHPRVTASVKHFNCNYGQLLEEFNTRINDNYYRWTISLNMNHQNKQQTIRKLETQIFNHISVVMENDDTRRSQFLQLEEQHLRSARNRWKKLWKRMRMFDGRYAPPGFRAQFDGVVTCDSLRFENYQPSTLYTMKMSKYRTRSHMRPFLKIKLLEPALVTAQLEKQTKALQSRQMRVQQNKISIVKSYMKQAGRVLKNYVVSQRDGWNKQRISQLAASIRSGFAAMNLSILEEPRNQGKRMQRQLTSTEPMLVQTPNRRRSTVSAMKTPTLERRLSVTVQVSSDSQQQQIIIDASYTFLNIKCQWVKSLTTRIGTLSLSQEGHLIFQYEKIDQKPSHLTLRQHALQPNRGLIKQWSIRDVEQIAYRIYILNENAIEIYLVDGDSVYLCFNSADDVELVQAKLGDAIAILQHNSPMWNDSTSIEKAAAQWVRGKISTFTYLMLLNSHSCRSYRDLTRYPIAPWVLKGRINKMEPCFNIEESLQLVEDVGCYRNLQESMGNAGSQQRVDEFLLRYEMQEDQEKFHFGSHYSSSAILSQFLVRIEPYTTAAKEIQGGHFDLPDRIFGSVVKSWIDATEELADVRELVPEFYFLPEMFLNLQKLNFGKMQTNVQVNNVELPMFANSNPFVYTTSNRMAIEGPICTGMFHQWVDLIWGYKARGPEAVKALNVFYPFTYPEHLQSMQPFSDAITRLSIETQVANFGLTPQQLFTAPHPARQTVPKNTIFFKNQNLQMFEAQSKRTRKVRASISENENDQLIIQLQWLGSNRIVCLKRNGLFTTYRWQPIAPNPVLQNFVPFTFAQEREKQLTLFRTKEQLYSMLDQSVQYKRYPVLLANETKILIVGGMWDGVLHVINTESDTVLDIYKHHSDTITAMAIDETCSKLITGTKTGQATLWSINTEYKFQPKSTWHDHSDQIGLIEVSDELRIFITASLDQRMNMYNLHSGQFYRTIFNPDGLTVHHLNIADSPLPCIIFSSDDNDIIYTYSVNGFLLGSLMETSPLTATKLVTNPSNFGQHLIYTTNMGSSFMLTLPFLQHKVYLPTTISEISQIQFTADAKFVLYGSVSGDIYVATDMA